MPKRLQRPSVQLAFHTDVPGDQSPTYPSGLALPPQTPRRGGQGENAVVKMFDRTSGSFPEDHRRRRQLAPREAFRCRVPGQDGHDRGLCRIPRPAPSDVFETLSGKFLRSFAGEIRHPRGLAITPGTGQVVVVDGHLRHLHLPRSHHGGDAAEVDTVVHKQRQGFVPCGRWSQKRSRPRP